VATEPSASMATLCVGDGAWTGGSGAFLGSTLGTRLGANAASGFAGGLMDLQAAGVSKMFVAASGRTGVGVTSDLSTFTVKGVASIDWPTGVTLTAKQPTISGTGFTLGANPVSVGDRVEVTVTASGNKYTAAVTEVTSNTVLTVDVPFPEGGAASLKVFPSLIKFKGSDGSEKIIVDDQGFMALAGVPGAPAKVNDNEKDGYVICKVDHPFVDPNQEMRGYQSTMRYIRTSNHPDGNVLYGSRSKVNLKVDTVDAQNNTSTVTWKTGLKFLTNSHWNGIRIDIDGKRYTIVSVTDDTHLTVTPFTGTNTNVYANIYQTYSETGDYDGEGWDVFWIRRSCKRRGYEPAEHEHRSSWLHEALPVGTVLHEEGGWRAEVQRAQARAELRRLPYDGRSRGITDRTVLDQPLGWPSRWQAR